MKPTKLPYKLVSAKKYYNPKSFYYEFPFEVLHPKYGRIEWHVEPFRSNKKNGRYYINRLYVWTRQTDDKRYQGKVFDIPVETEALFTLRHQGGSFFQGVWRVMFCEKHKNPVFESYPEDYHNVLRIEAMSSIGIEISYGKI